MSKTKCFSQGVYNVINVAKFIGSETGSNETAIYRSSWEKIAFMYLDNDDNIKKWGSECVVIPYKFRLDPPGKIRRYYMDLLFKDEYGSHLVEIKPKFKTNFNKIKRMQNDRYMKEYIQNIDKWNYASAFAKEHNMTFTIWTEEHIDELKRRIAVYKL